MKTVSKDRTHIDYTFRNFGVRICRSHCQVIIREDEGGVWTEREKTFSIPVPSVFELRHFATPVSALAHEARRYEDNERDPELRYLLEGWMTFEEAISGTALTERLFDDPTATAVATEIPGFQRVE